MICVRRVCSTLLLVCLAVEVLSAQGNENWIDGWRLSGPEDDIRVAIWDGSDLFIGGEFTSVTGDAINYIARWDGSAWEGLGVGDSNGVNGPVYAIAVNGDNVYVGGSFTEAGGVKTKNIAVWNRRTETWSRLGDGLRGLPTSRVESLILHEGQVYAGGSFVVAGSIISVNIARWDGSKWHRVGTGVNDDVYALTVDEEYLYAGGDFTVAGDIPSHGVARYHIPTSQWEGMNSSLTILQTTLRTTVRAIVADENFIYIGGYFDVISGKTVNNVARWKKTTGEWSDLNLGVSRTPQPVYNTDYLGRPVVHALAMWQGDLLVGGEFDMLVSRPTEYPPRILPHIDTLAWTTTHTILNIVRWHTRTEEWSAWGNGLVYDNATFTKIFLYGGVVSSSSTVLPGFNPAWVSTIAVADGGEVTFGGHFNLFGGGSLALTSVATNFRSKVMTSNICKLKETDTGDVWSVLGDDGYGAGYDEQIQAMVDDGEFIYVAGVFEDLSSGASNIVRINKETNVRESLGENTSTGPFKILEVTSLAMIGEDLYATGRFGYGNLDSIPNRTRVARWNKQQREWTPLEDVFTSLPGYTLVVMGNDILVGDWKGLRIWDGESWSIPEGGPSGAVYSICVQGDDVYLAGNFTTVGTDTVNNIVRWNRISGEWSPLGKGIDIRVFGGGIFALTFWEGKLYAGGNYLSAGGVPQTADLASWDPVSERWEPVFTGIESSGRSVYALCPTQYGLYIGGLFEIFTTTGATNTAQNIALLSKSGWNALGDGVISLVGVDIFDPRPRPNSIVLALVSDGKLLHVGGNFDVVGNRSAINFAQWLLAPPPIAVEGDDADDPSSIFADVTPSENAEPHTSTSDDDIFWDEQFAALAAASGTSDDVFALAADREEVYVGGAFDNVVGIQANSIALWNGNDWEALDDGVASGVNGLVFALLLEGDDLYVGGQFTHAGEIEANNIAVWNRKTRRWRRLGAGLQGDQTNVPFVSDILIKNGEVYVGGQFAQAGSRQANNVAKWNGRVWEPLGEGVDGTIADLQEYRGDIYVGGSFGTAGGESSSGVAFWDGTAWHGMNGGVSGVVNCLEVMEYPYRRFDPLKVIDTLASYPDSILVIGGKFTVSGVREDSFINEVSTYTWRTIQNVVGWGENSLSGRSEFVQAMLLSSSQMEEVRDILADGVNMYIAGNYQFDIDDEGRASSQGVRKNICVIYNDTIIRWSTFGGPYREAPLFDMQFGVDGPVNALVKSRNRIIAGGSFSTAAHVRAANIAEWDIVVERWRPLVSGAPLGSNRVLTFHRNSLYSGGSFRIKEDPDEYVKKENYIARVGSTGWHVVDGIVRGDIYSITDAGDELFIGGAFTTADGKIAVNVVRWDSLSGSWSAVTPGSGLADDNGVSYVVALKATDEKLYVGGRFNVVDTFVTPHVASWNRTTGIWERLGSGLDQPVWALDVDEDGVLYAGGDFSYSGNKPVRGVARWDGTEWQPLGEGVDGNVRSLIVAEGKVYVGGTFNQVGGDVEATNIAVWDIATQTWSSLGEGLSARFKPSVLALAYKDGILFAGGNFTVSGIDSVYNIAKWDGVRWQGLGSGANSSVWAIVLQEGEVYVAGAFTKVGQKNSPFLGLWHEPTLSVDEYWEAPTAGTAESLPNPFESTTTIHYTLPRYSQVAIGIYDVRGVEVTRLVDDRREAGAHWIEWKPEASIPSGLYVIRMYVDGQVITRKIVRQ
ncbi:MAG: T9SS type A sorting domain-containing protein [Ignavibacteriae bacterium]|nr:T9SS type A sorting domain-containing protein [Ignavibacteriota bacterium]MCB9217500.1 T9SS type A sorting domain-containing protein [Ignavibacteria bacterium]